MPISNQKSSPLAAPNRRIVARPTNSTTGNTNSAKRRKFGPNAVAWATSASATTAADSTVTNIEARLKTSFHVMLRVASRLQCSVARICARTASVTPLRSENGDGRAESVGKESLIAVATFYPSVSTGRRNDMVRDANSWMATSLPDFRHLEENRPLFDEDTPTALAYIWMPRP